MPDRQTGTFVAHVCGECNHKHLDHSATRNKRCSMEWCKCTRSQAEVIEAEVGVDRPVFAVLAMR